MTSPLCYPSVLKGKGEGYSKARSSMGKLFNFTKPGYCKANMPVPVLEPRGMLLTHCPGSAGQWFVCLPLVGKTQI